MRLQGWWLNCRAQQLQPTLWWEWIDGATEKRIECNFIFYWVWLKCLIKCFHFFLYISGDSVDVLHSFLFCFFQSCVGVFSFQIIQYWFGVISTTGVKRRLLDRLTRDGLNGASQQLQDVSTLGGFTPPGDVHAQKSPGFFSKKDMNEWITKWITVLQGENSSPLWMWSCRLPLHSPWLPWLPCVTALAGQQPKRLRYNLKFPPVPLSWWKETASVRRLSCGQEDKNASHHYIPPVIRPPGWNGGSWCQHLTVCSTLPSPNEETVQRWWAAQWIHLLVQ